MNGAHFQVRLSSKIHEAILVDLSTREDQKTRPGDGTKKQEIPRC